MDPYAIQTSVASTPVVYYLYNKHAEVHSGLGDLLEYGESLYMGVVIYVVLEACERNESMVRSNRGRQTASDTGRNTVQGDRQGPLSIGRAVDDTPKDDVSRSPRDIGRELLRDVVDGNVSGIYEGRGGETDLTRDSNSPALSDGEMFFDDDFGSNARREATRTATFDK